MFYISYSENLYTHLHIPHLEAKLYDTDVHKMSSATHTHHNGD